MLDLIRLCFGAMLRAFCARRSLVLENLALRQQLAVFKRKHPRPSLGALDKLFWVLARRFWPQWKEMLVIVLPETVARWHRAGFKLYWSMLCKVRNRVGGGRRISKELGCTSHSWRTPHARLRGIGGNNLPLDEASPQSPRSC
jgi:hypothetical protein